MKQFLKSSLALLLALAMLAACAGAGQFSAPEADVSAGEVSAAASADDLEPSEAPDASGPESAASPEAAETLTPAAAETEESVPEANPEENPDKNVPEANPAAETNESVPETAPEEADESDSAEADASAPALSAQATAPQMALTVVPRCGSSLPVQGVVIDSDGNAVQGGSYRVTLYVELTQFNTFWVKPSEATPFVEVNRDGSFSLKYDGGGVSDRNAERLHILLLPADYTPTLHGIQEARANALDYVKVVRDENGGVTVTPNRQAPTPSKGKSSGLKTSDKRIAVNVGFYTQGQPGDKLTEQQVKALLTQVKPFADIVRFYSAGGEVSKAYKIAHDMGLKVVGTAWLSGSSANDRAELDKLIDQCNKGYVQVACVGSETLLRKDLSAEQLIEYLNYVRKKLRNQSIPVTTADSAGELINAPDVRGACDLLMPNIYPYWEGVAVKDAGAAFASAMEQMSGCAAGKEILVSETGWPTDGETKQDAVASDANAAAYFEAVRQWSLDHKTVVLWFDALDEPWKQRDEGVAGAHWGLLTKDGKLKSGYGKTAFFKSVLSVGKPKLQSAQNARGGVKLGWSKAKGAVRYELCCKNGKAWKVVAKTKKTALLVKTSNGKRALQSGRRYTFAVRSVNAAGKKSMSAAKSVVYVTAPAWKAAKNSQPGTLTVTRKGAAGLSGWQVQYSTDKRFPKGSGSVSVAGAKAVSVKVTGLTRGKTYHLRLRGYKTVSGKKVYSGWSAVKKVKIAK